VHFKNAIAASPKWSLAYLYYGLFLVSAFRHDEAVQPIRTALELDPLSPFNYALGGWFLARCGLVEEGEALVRRSLELQPDYILGTWILAAMHAKQHRFDEAIDLLERVVKISRSPIFVGLLGEVYGMAGRHADVDTLITELDERQARGEYIAPFARVMLHAGRRDRAGLRAALEACLAEDVSWFSLNVAVSGTLPDVVRDAELEGLLDRLYGGVWPRQRP
jgi:tetratricopeptide (TPR) repeat protein